MIYENEHLKEISFPLGGIGTGSIGLAGNGRLIDWEIFNRPAKGSVNGFSHIGIKAKNKNGIVTKILNGDTTENYMGQYRDGYWQGYGFGPLAEGMSGFPHFQNLKFKGEFPIAELLFSDGDFPAKVKLSAFNPFIPSDGKNSSIPGAFFEFEICNNDEEETEYFVEFTVVNPNSEGFNTKSKSDNISMIFMHPANKSRDDLEYKDMCIATDCVETFIQSYCYRGWYMDKAVAFWNDISADEDLKERLYDSPGAEDSCILCAKVTAKPKEVKKVRFVLSWNTPNCYNYWDEYKDENGNHITWKNYYATVFENSKASAIYSLKNWDMLYEKTLKFKNSLFSSTLDESVLDAVSANLSVLKSPTVLRLENGEFYGWEGVHQKFGSCEGTCQHVWNYAYALCYLFPDLERSIRELEFKYSTKKTGQMVFRLKLPLGRYEGDFRACVDGQMGAVIKTYREWKLSGDNNWLKKYWEDIKNVLEYAWSDENEDLWDNDKDGVLEGRQHHTLDKEFFGPSSWLQSMYLAALLAASKMAEALGDKEKAEEYLNVFEKGKKWTKENLFNGEYFIQKIDLNDKSLVERFDASEYWDEESGEIKYQIKEGSIIDQMLGVWHSNLLDIGEIFDSQQVKTALSSMFKLNYRNEMRTMVNPWRVFSSDDEAGTIICAFSEKHQKPKHPIAYYGETMTGFEYQFAGLLIQNGMTDEGLKVVKAIRDRYDGKKRNPWNEIECGSNYARSMASFALISAYSGFKADLPNKTLKFNPVIKETPFTAFFAVDGCFGTFNILSNCISLDITEGEILLSSLTLPFVKNAKSVIIDSKPFDFENKNGQIIFDETIIKNKIEIMI